MTPILEVKHLSKIFTSIFKTQKFTAVNNVSFSLQSGEILGLLGSNGAGKTTLMQMLLSTLTPTKGTIKYFGLDLNKNRSKILKKVGFASSYTKLPPNLLVRENLKIIGQLYGMTANKSQEKALELLNILNMSQIYDKKNGVLSAGQSAVVQLVKALMIEPKIVILDEPMAAIDVEIAQRARDLLKLYRKDCGLSIIITSHNMQEIEQLVDRVLIMKSGQIIADASPTQLIKEVTTSHIYLTVEKALEFEKYLAASRYDWTLEDNEFHVTIKENLIPEFLNNMVLHDIKYHQIEIKRPNLEDYFLAVTKHRSAL